MSAIGERSCYSVVTSQEKLADSYPENTAVLCSTDYYAMQVYVRCPQVKVMGFDNLKLLDRLHLPIDSVNYDTAMIAKEAFALLESEEHRDVVIPHSIVCR